MSVIILSFNPQYEVNATVSPSYNCSCDDDAFPTKSLKDLRCMLMTRLGFAAMMVPPPGMVPLLDSFLIEAQELLYRRYRVFRCERWFTWTMQEGVRFYDIDQNDDAMNGLIASPAAPSVTTATTGGSLAASMYGYAVTALNGNGETTPSAITNITTTGTTSVNTVTWTGNADATSYNIYSTGPRVSGTYAPLRLIGNTTALTFADPGGLALGKEAPDLNTTAACAKTLDPRSVTWVGISRGDNVWRPLSCGIEPVRFRSPIYAIPDSYEIRQCIEVWPAPQDDSWLLRIKGYFGLQPFHRDDDVTTIDYRAVFMLALANAKAHYGQPDGGNVAQQLTALLGDYISGSHQTRRYIPGHVEYPPAVPPLKV